MSTQKGLLNDESSGSPALSDSAVSRFFREIGEELKHQGKMGTHELAAAIMRNHDGFVMYQRDGVEDNKDKPGNGMYGPDTMAGLKAEANQIVHDEPDKSMGLER